MKDDWFVAIIGGGVGAFIGSALYTLSVEMWHHHKRQKEWRAMIHEVDTKNRRWTVKE